MFSQLEEVGVVASVTSVERAATWQETAPTLPKVWKELVGVLVV